MVSGKQRKPNTRLRWHRQNRGWSLRKVADLIQAKSAEEEEVCGITDNLVGRWERGIAFPGPFYREKLCQAFDLTAVELGLLEDISSIAATVPSSALSAKTLPTSDSSEDVEIIDAEYVEAVPDGSGFTVSSSAHVIQLSQTQYSALFEKAFQRQETFAPSGSEIRVLASCTIPTLPRETASADSALWFVLKQQQWQTLIRSYYGHVSMCGELQAHLYQEFDAMKPQPHNEAYTISRRQAMGAIAAFPLSLMASLQGQPVTLIPEEFLPQCAASIAACWSLLNGSEFSSIVGEVLPMYLPTLTLYAQHSSQYQKTAASLTSQAYQLMCELATDQENFGTARDAGRRALLYAQLAEDSHLQVAALIRQANLHFHRKQSTSALRAYQQSLPLLNESSPLLRGRVYAGLAEVLGMRNQHQEAMSFMGLAHENYPGQPDQDPAFPYTHFSRYDLYVFAEGQTRLFLSQPKEAQESFAYVEKNLLTPQAEPLTQVDLTYYQATTSMKLDDLVPCCAYISKAVILARSVDSHLYYNKIFNIYQEMKEKWGHERQVTALEEVFQPW